MLKQISLVIRNDESYEHEESLELRTEWKHV